ncbi:hypothetical protein TNCV_2046571 [Trichonephila clavipes]|uniref:Reverse transcriptase domain-containing protein n=1 Tax=Trichonephila clavipes TaxID=2585209 RepID=A0A8X6SRJ9_TRICX|nr:hypothetical protein TNCV_2046571 [Trichonephila clavipes]
MSKGIKLSQGLPQDSVLSPTLFTLFMCGIEEVISRRCFGHVDVDSNVLYKLTVSPSNQWFPTKDFVTAVSQWSRQRTHDQRVMSSGLVPLKTRRTEVADAGSLSRGSNILPMVLKLGEGGQLICRPRNLTMVQNNEVSKTPRVAE